MKQNKKVNSSDIIAVCSKKYEFLVRRRYYLILEEILSVLQCSNISLSDLMVLPHFRTLKIAKQILEGQTDHLNGKIQISDVFLLADII